MFFTQPSCPWFNCECGQAIHQRNRAYRLSMRSSPENLFFRSPEPLHVAPSAQPGGRPWVRMSADSPPGHWFPRHWTCYGRSRGNVFPFLLLILCSRKGLRHVFGYCQPADKIFRMPFPCQKLLLSLPALSRSQGNAPNIVPVWWLSSLQVCKRHACLCLSRSRNLSWPWYHSLVDVEITCWIVRWTSC